MAIQGRRGIYMDFDPQKLLPGEWATVTSGDPHAADGRAVYMCFAAGDVKRMATYEDMVENIQEASGDAIDLQIEKAMGEAVRSCREATGQANTAAPKADTAASRANQAAADADTATARANNAAAECEGIIDDVRAYLGNALYPVGSIYISVNPTNPSACFGGTWEAWGAGRVPVGIDAADSNFNTAEKTGGAAEVALSTAQMPAHAHGLNSHTHGAGTLKTASDGAHQHKVQYSKTAGAGSAENSIKNEGTGWSAKSATESAGSHTHTLSGSTGGASGNTASTGSGQAHNNLQPYITCYMWKRVA